MSKITTTNYEAFLLDYWEGNLPAEDIAELVLFINNHPELNIDLDDLTENEQLIVSFINADFKDNLKKTSANVLERFNILCLAFYDKTITTSEKIALDVLIKEFPKLETEFNCFGNTYLKPDLNLIFPNKSILQKSFIPTNSFEYKAIQYIENEMSISEKEAFEKEISENEALKIEFNKYKLTQLVDVDILFEHKNKIYKNENRKALIPVWMGYAAAAALFISAGLYFINNDGPTIKNGLSSIQPDTAKYIRPIKNNTPENDFILNEEFTISNNKKEKITPSFQENKLIPAPTPLFVLQPKNSNEIKMPFILETEYLATYPLSPLLLNDLAEIEVPNKSFISASDLLVKKLRKILKKENINIDTPLENIKENGFTESSIKGLEKITNGAISVQRENTEKGRRYTGFSIGSLSYSRSNSK